MSHGENVLSGPAAHRFENLLFDFQEDFAALSQFLNVLRIVNDAYEAKVEVAADSLNPEETDMGDVYYEATKLLGLDPYDIANHAGMMILSRGAGLYETYLARVAARFFSNADGIIYDGGKSWSRDEADQFFHTCLARGVRPWRGSMKWISQLRDLYAHGYGEPLSSDLATTLAGELWRIARADEKPTPAEIAVGLGEGAHLFGPFDKYSPKTGIQALSFSTVRFALSPLITHRLLGEIEYSMGRVFEAASWNTKENLSAANSNFVRRMDEKLARSQGSN